MAKSLFEHYGGFAAVSKVVMSFYDKVLDSDVLADYFEGVDMRRLIDHQTKFMSQVLGGPAVYSDQQLAVLHQSLGITPTAFHEMIRLLRQTFVESGFAERDIDIVIADLDKREALIVGRPAE